jgi:DNA replication and repair protein RecF
MGANGAGKTNLLEAIGWLATLSSFRGAPNEALVRVGAARAVVRAEGDRDGRALLVEAELPTRGRTRVQVNRQPLRRTRDLLGALRVSVFSPDDLLLVKGGPAERRRLLDEALVALSPRWDALQGDVERVLRQRGALLKQAGGRLGPDVATTLDVWDAKLASAGSELARGRGELVATLEPVVTKAHDQLALSRSEVGLAYEASWAGSAGDLSAERLAAALSAARQDDVRRGVSTVGPHRDELVLRLAGLPARLYASQGEQRTLALALRLAVHATVADRVGTPPILLLDDVFSELDPTRTEALVAHLPAGQALLTTAGDLPSGMQADATVRVVDGRLVPE